MHFITTNKHYFYLLLAIIGGGMTFYYIILGIIDHNGNFDSMEFIRSTWVDNNYAKSLTLDFWTGAIAGTFFILVEGLRLGMKRIWIYIVLTIFIAFAFGFPLFLFMRAVHLNNTQIKA